MDMAVDESWHQGSSTAIDYCGEITLDWLVGDFADSSALNQQLITAPNFIQTRLQEPKILKEILTHEGLAPVWLECRWRRQ
jgi:hypothetical protein